VRNGWECVGCVIAEEVVSGSGYQNVMARENWAAMRKKITPSRKAKIFLLVFLFIHHNILWPA
jgi:hypothetical protein